MNDLKRRNSPYVFSRNSTVIQADYITVVEDRPIGVMSVKLKSLKARPLLELVEELRVSGVGLVVSEW